jgi:hypothetical protein
MFKKKEPLRYRVLVKLLHHKRKWGSRGLQIWLLTRVGTGIKKGTSGVDKFSSVVDRVQLELGSKFFTL